MSQPADPAAAQQPRSADDAGHRRARLAARLGLAFFGLLVLAALTLAVANHSLNLEILVQVVAFSSFAVVGAVLLDQGAHRIGWICLIIGIGGVLNGLSQEILRSSQTTPGSPWAAAALAAQLVFGYPSTGLAFTFLPLLFPDGRLPSRRWRPVAVLAIVDLLVLVVAGGLTTPGLFATGAENPFAVIPAGAPSQAITSLAAALTLVTGLLCASALVFRYRQADHVERQQLKWVAGAVAVFAASLVVSILLPPLDTFAWVMPLLPISVGIAILRYRLYDIDLLISRALVYVPLTALLGGLYAASVALFQRLFIGVTGQTSDAAIVLTTLILAAVFTPVRKALEGAVERRWRPPAEVAPVVPASMSMDAALEARMISIARAAVDEALADRDRIEAGKRRSGSRGG